MKTLLITFINIILILNLANAGKRGELKVAFIDVGHGDAILIKTPSGFSALIDGGVKGKDTVIQKVMNKLSIKDRIDSIVLTNPTSEHVGSLPDIINSYDVGNVYDPGMPFGTVAYEKFLEVIMIKQDQLGSGASDDNRLADILAKKNHYEYFNPKAGEVLNWGPDVEVTVLSPPRLYHNTRSDPNNNSITVKLVYDQISFLFTGNIEMNAEKYLAGQGRKINTTILKIPNHGSPYSSNPYFINRVKPKVSILMVGKNNKYGYPSTKVLERIKKTGSSIYRTDLNGTVYVTTDGRSYNVNPDKETGDAKIVAKTYKAKKGVEDSGNKLIKEKKINVNKATADDLVSIPGLGAFKAQMIIRYRNKKGPFNTMDDLLKVPGINKGVLNKIKDKITLK